MLNTNSNKQTVKSRLLAGLNSNFNKGSVKFRSLTGRTTTLVLAILFAAGLNTIRAEDTWTQKATFGGIARAGATGFSIASKGYLGLGDQYPISYKDFWEYDPASDTWTQKADFGGNGRLYAVGFVIDGNAYVGTGQSGTYPNYTYYKDFWKYDPNSNIWTQKADFGGTARFGAVGFSINGKGYLGTGTQSLSGDRKDFWEYDPLQDSWTQKADFGGIERRWAVGFNIGSRGYVGTGGRTSELKDFWEYDPASDTWTQKSDFAGSARQAAFGFSLGDKGYIGTGSYYTKDFWQYDPSTNIWIQKTEFGGSARNQASGFAIGNKAYIGTGADPTYKKDFWEYDAGISSCSVPTNLSATNITPSSAKFKWDAVPGAEGYGIRYKVAGISGWKHRTSYDNSKFIGGLSPNTEYTWQIRTYCDTIRPAVTSAWSAKQHFTTGTLRVGNESEQVSFQIYPNPAEDHATIQFTLAQPSHVCIKVYDVSGKEIACPGLDGAVLIDSEQQEGDHSLELSTNHFSKGIYLVRMISDFGIDNQKLIVQ